MLYIILLSYIVVYCISRCYIEPISRNILIYIYYIAILVIVEVLYNLVFAIEWLIVIELVILD